MDPKKSIIIVLFLLLIPFIAFGADETYYVTPSGAGSHNGSLGNEWSITEFQDTGNWSNTDSSSDIDPGDTVYFTGDFTGTSSVTFPSSKGGTINAQITLDGYSGGSCDPWNDSCASGADVKKFILSSGSNYITIQDFDFITNDFGVTSADSTLITGTVVKHNHFYRQTLAPIHFRWHNDSIAFDNYIETNGDGTNINLNGGHGNKIIKNKINGGGTSHTGIIMRSDYANSGISGQTYGNIIAGNNVSGIVEEVISFDNVASSDNTTTLEADTVASSSTNTVTLANTAWDTAGNDIYNGAYMFFLTGALAGKVYEIMDEANDVFTFAETVSSAASGDRVSIASPFMKNYIGYNTVSLYDWDYASVLLYGASFGNLVEGHYDVEPDTDEAIYFQTQTRAYRHTGNITGACGVGPAFNNLSYNNLIKRNVAIYYEIPNQNCDDNPVAFRSWYNSFIDNTLTTGIYLYQQNMYASGNTVGIEVGSSQYSNSSIYMYSFPFIYGTPTVNTSTDTVTITWNKSIVSTGYTNGDFYLTTDTDIETTIDLESPSGSGATWSFTAASSLSPGTTYKLWFNAADDSIEDLSGNDMIVVGYKPLEAIAENAYTVTQDGSGADYSASTFNALEGDKSDNVYNFSGTFTTRIQVNIYGTSGHPVVLDGYESGSCDPINSTCSSSAILSLGLEVDNGEDYVTVQDFRITNASVNEPTCYWADSSNYSNWIFQRNYVYDSYATMFWVSDGSNWTIKDNKFSGYGRTGDAVQGINFIDMDNLIFRGNDAAGGGSSNCTSDNVIELHTSDNIIFEYNDIYDAYKQAGIAVKESSSGNHNVVIRFNKIHDNGAAGDGRALFIGWYNSYNIYIYGNFMYNNANIGFDISDGIDNVYVWSNLLINNVGAGISVWDRGEGYHSNGLYFYNNTFANNGYGQTTDTYYSIADISLSDGSNTNQNVKNNIFWNCRRNTPSTFHNVYDTTGATWDYNTFCSNETDATSADIAYYSTAYDTLSEWNAEATVGTDEALNQSGCAALFTDSNGSDNTDGTDDDDYTLTAMTTVGVDLSDCFNVTIQGVQYNICIDDALNPGIDWEENASGLEAQFASYPILKRDNVGWARGAYASVTSTAVYNVSPSDGEVNVSLTKVATWDSPFATDDIYLDQNDCDSVECTTIRSNDDTDNQYDMSSVINSQTNTTFCLGIKSDGGSGSCQEFEFTTTSGPPTPSTGTGGIAYAPTGLKVAYVGGSGGGAGGSSPTNYIADPNVVAAYFMDDTGTENDETSSGYNLTESGTAPTSATVPSGYGGTSRDFESGDSDYLYITEGSAPNLDIYGMNDVTLCAWFRMENPPTSGAWQYIAGKWGDNGYRQYQISVFESSGSVKMSAQISTTGSVTVIANSTTNLSASTWYHGCLVYDQTNVEIWLNGTREAYTQSTEGIYNSANNFMIGGRDTTGGGHNYHFDGLIDEVIVFNTAFGSTEINEIKDYGIDGEKGSND